MGRVRPNSSKATPERRTFICKRDLHVAGSDKIVVVTLGRPYRDKYFSGVWTCDFTICGDEISVEGHVRGEDSFQAVSLGIEAIRLKLEGLKIRLTWLDTGDHGFPQIVPMFLPPRYRRAVGRAIGQQTRLAIKDARARAEKKKVPRKKKKKKKVKKGV
jgi:hypothetical protein